MNGLIRKVGKRERLRGDNAPTLAEVTSELCI
jgi:hypothetical protein